MKSINFLQNDLQLNTAEATAAINSRINSEESNLVGTFSNVDNGRVLSHMDSLRLSSSSPEFDEHLNNKGKLFCLNSLVSQIFVFDVLLIYSKFGIFHPQTRS